MPTPSRYEAPISSVLAQNELTLFKAETDFQGGQLDESRQSVEGLSVVYLEENRLKAAQRLSELGQYHNLERPTQYNLARALRNGTRVAGMISFTASDEQSRVHLWFDSDQQPSADNTEQATSLQSGIKGHGYYVKDGVALLLNQETSARAAGFFLQAVQEQGKLERLGIHTDNLLIDRSESGLFDKEAVAASIALVLMKHREQSANLSVRVSAFRFGQVAAAVPEEKPIDPSLLPPADFEGYYKATGGLPPAGYSPEQEAIDRAQRATVDRRVRAVEHALVTQLIGEETDFSSLPQVVSVGTTSPRDLYWGLAHTPIDINGQKHTFQIRYLQDGRAVIKVSMRDEATSTEKIHSLSIGGNITEVINDSPVAVDYGVATMHSAVLTSEQLASNFRLQAGIEEEEWNDLWEVQETQERTASASKQSDRSQTYNLQQHQKLMY